jgi:uncharacterized protein
VIGMPVALLAMQGVFGTGESVHKAREPVTRPHSTIHIRLWMSVLAEMENGEMKRQVMWSPWTIPGLEHVQVFTQPDGIVADGLILGVMEQEPFRVRYEIQCDQLWKLRAVHISLLGGVSGSLHLITDGEGSWATETGEALLSLMGCLDVDISATPFTNTLPIRRLALQSGVSATLSIAYVTVPKLQVEVTEQRYTCLETTSSGGRYWFESLEQGEAIFTAELLVDQDGLVVDYPELFRRVAAW